MTTRLRAWCGALALTLLAPITAAAQPPRNPFAELFGRTPERAGREFTAVQFRSTAGAQIGETLEAGFQATDTLIPDGLSGRADGMLLLQHLRDRVQIAGQARYSYQEFRASPAFGAPGFDVNGRADWKATTRLAFHAAGQYIRSPFFQSMWLTAAQAGTMAPMDRSAILLMRNDTVEGSGGITSNYSKRSSLSLTGTVRNTSFALRPQDSFSAVGGRAQWRRQMSRDLAVRAAYGRDELRSQAAEGEQLFINELLDVGVEFGRAVSLARRTSFTFGTETSMLRDQNRGRHFRLNGHLALTQRFLRTWSAQLSARRGTDFLPGFRAPVLTDQAMLALDGFPAKRVILNVAANAGRGEIGFNDSRRFASYIGSAKLTFAMTRNFGVFTQYLYNHYQSPPQLGTLFLVPRGVRQAISVGVETWIPIYNKDKVSRDSR